MELLDYTTEWVKGEVFQGRIMLFVGILLSISGWMIFKSEHDVLKGTLIPIALMLLVFLGYGGFVAFSRPGHLEKVKTTYAESPVKALEMEQEKALRDHAAYSRLKPIWVVLIAVAAILYFLGGEYLKGLSIGLIGMFLSVLIVDTTLHHRLGFYKAGIEKLLSEVKR